MSRSHSTAAARVAGRLAARIAAIVGECNDATRRLGELRADPGRYVSPLTHEPMTYAEFLDRTAGELAHEPAAMARIAGTVRTSARHR